MSKTEAIFPSGPRRGQVEVGRNGFLQVMEPAGPLRFEPYPAEQPFRVKATNYDVTEVAFAGRRFRAWRAWPGEFEPEEVISALIDAHPDDVRRVEVKR